MPGVLGFCLKKENNSMLPLHIDSSFTKCIDPCTTGQRIIPKAFSNSRGEKHFGRKEFNPKSPNLKPSNTTTTTAQYYFLLHWGFKMFNYEPFEKRIIC